MAKRKNNIKKKKGSGAVKAWGIVTAIVLVLGITVNYLASTMFYNLMNTMFEGPTIEIVGEDSSRFELDEGITDKATALANANKTNQEICREGYTLLKNKDAALPLAAGAKVTVFGKNSVNMAVGGSGSGGASGAGIKTIFDSLTAAGFTYNEVTKAFYEDNNRSGVGRVVDTSDLDSGKVQDLSESFVGETPISSYDDALWSSCENYKDAALIVITRVGGEGFDLPRNANDHILKLRPNEKALIEEVKAKGFDKVVILLNAATSLELGDVEKDAGVDAILWIGYSGTTGIMALGEVLKGETNEGIQFSPSGKTVDTYAADFMKDPTWNNLGGALNDPNSTADDRIPGDAYYVPGGRSPRDQQVYFVDYEESLYVGYRYYETAYAEAQKGNYDGFNYDEAVVYPFGYGLSYTNFSWTLENESEISALTIGKETSVTFKVKVKNEGSYAGQDTVQIYVTAPYTNGGIEKPAKMLVGFAKTDVLAPGAEEVLEITVDSPYDFASYDYKGISGTKGYVVEEGNYTFTISTDSHNAKAMDDAVITKFINKIVYDKSTVNEDVTVTNLYTDNADVSLNSDTGLDQKLSRANFAGTWPQIAKAAEKNVENNTAWIEKFKSLESNPNRPAMNDKMITTGAENNISFMQLVGVDYDDELWDRFMDQLTIEEMTSLVNNGGFQTEAIARLGVPLTINADGPVGFVAPAFMTDANKTIYDTCSYCCEVVLSSTWNVECLEAMGRALGNEALIGNEKGGGMPYTGWYAPGLNIHRSPFSGRNFEYYSEDPFLSGQMTAAVIKGAAEKGVYVNMKHFALNDQETHRMINGLLTWVDEQAMREVYLKAFEVAIKTAKEEYDVKSMGVMSSFNRIGEVWAGGDYRLLTTILRDEWGFEGLVICDFNTNDYMNEKEMFYAGGDLNLQIAGMMVWTPDSNSAMDMVVLRQAAKNVLYTVANSNAVRGEFIMHRPAWQNLMFTVDGVIAVLLLVWGIAAISKSSKKLKKNTKKKVRY